MYNICGIAGLDLVVHVVTPPEEYKQLAGTGRTVTEVKSSSQRCSYDENNQPLRTRCVRIANSRDTTGDIRVVTRFLRYCRFGHSVAVSFSVCRSRRWRDLASRRPSAQRRAPPPCLRIDRAGDVLAIARAARWQQRRTGFKHAVSCRPTLPVVGASTKWHSPIFRATSDPLTY